MATEVAKPSSAWASVATSLIRDGVDRSPDIDHRLAGGFVGDLIATDCRKEQIAATSAAERVLQGRRTERVRIFNLKLPLSPPPLRMSVTRWA